jgi:methylated-DNA-protein-cysteine methyltransferase-like protein
VTYGQVALLAGAPRAARQVGGVLNRVRQPDQVPWQRVINAEGMISTYRIGAGELQRALLEAEGVKFDADGRVDLRLFRWDPEPAELAAGKLAGDSLTG